MVFNFSKNANALSNLKLADKRNCVTIDYESGVSPISIDKSMATKVATFVLFHVSRSY